MNVTICDYDECQEWATFHVEVTENDPLWKGYEFDACTVAHITRHMAEINATARKLEKAEA